jgi:hypothetical protein
MPIANRKVENDLVHSVGVRLRRMSRSAVQCEVERELPSVEVLTFSPSRKASASLIVLKPLWVSFAREHWPNILQFDILYSEALTNYRHTC